MINLIITEDHPIVLDGLKQLLQADNNINITGVYTNGAELLKALESGLPDVLLLDMNLPDTTGGELVPLLLNMHPQLRILVLSSTESITFVKTMLECGCMGYLLKSRTNQTMLSEAIRSVFEDKPYLDPSLKDDLLFGLAKTKNKLQENSLALTRRETEILKMITAEYNTVEIAEKLSLSLRTVENHRYNLMRKLNVKNTVGLVKFAMKTGLLTDAS